VILVVCFSQPPELRWLPHMDIGNPLFWTAHGAPLVHTEEKHILYTTILSSQNTHSIPGHSAIYPLSQQATHSLSKPGNALKKWTNRATQTRHILHIKFIGGHAQASSEGSSTRPSAPTEARYNKTFPLIHPTLNSRRAPATNEACKTPQGPAASSLSKCKSFIKGWPKRPYDSTE
jgi:hypothetical protein